MRGSEPERDAVEVEGERVGSPFTETERGTMGRTCRGPPRAARLSAACPRRRANYSNASAGGDQVEQTRPLGFPLLSRYPRARRSCPPRRAVSWKSRERAEAARAGAGLSSAPSPRVGKPSVICCEEQRGAAGKREGVMDRAG